MMNKRVMEGKPFVALGKFWQPIIDRVREVEMGPHASEMPRWGEAGVRLIQSVQSAEEAAEHLWAQLK
jgi:hypothetical protein